MFHKCAKIFFFLEWSVAISHASWTERVLKATGHQSASWALVRPLSGRPIVHQYVAYPSGTPVIAQMTAYPVRPASEKKKILKSLISEKKKKKSLDF